MMAPESERAKKEQWIQEGCVWEACRKCGRNHKLGECTPKPNEPALTCSEVVERLANECVMTCHGLGAFDREAAEKILNSWRERRVQELEEALRITSASIAKEMNRFDYEELDGSGAIITAEEVYKQSLEKAKAALGGGSHGE